MRRIVVIFGAVLGLSHCGAVAPVEVAPSPCTDEDVASGDLTALDATDDRLVWGTRAGAVMAHEPSGDVELGRLPSTVRSVAQTATQVFAADESTVVAFDRTTRASLSPFGTIARPIAVAASGDRVCLLEDDPVLRQGRLRCIGGASPAIDVPFVQPRALATNATFAFVSAWTSSGERTVRVSLADGATLPVASRARWSLAADEARVYVAFDGGPAAPAIAGLRTYAVSGSELDADPVPFADDQGTMSGLALGGDAAWIATAATLFRHPKAGGSPTATGAGAGQAWGPLAASAKALYRTHVRSSTGATTIERRCSP